MKKVGILTFHDGINYGAFMQVYCLYHTIRDLGFEVEIINYKNIEHWWKEWAYFLAKKSALSNLRKIRKFHSLQQELQRSFFSFDLDKIVSRLQYDIIVVGSDEVWNVNNCLFGFDSGYFGIDSPCIWVSYAPSFGSTSVDDLKLNRIRKNLKGFDSVSVRDDNSSEIVGLLTGSFPQTVPDPTLLRETPELEIETSFDSPYCLVYSASKFSSAEQNEIIKYASENKKKLVSVGTMRKWCDVSFSEAGVGEWLGLYRQADVVFTSMFHGTIFSIKYKKPFCLFMDTYRTNKFYPLLSMLLLQNRIYRIGGLTHTMSQAIDYQLVSKRLAQYKSNGINFLKNSLSVHPEVH